MMAIFQYDFMIRALIVGVIISVVAPTIGSFLVVRRYSYMADTLAHVSLVGVAIGLLTKKSPVVLAIIVAILAALIIEKLRQSRKIFGETILAIFLSGSLAVAVVIISLANGFNSSLFSYLFGSLTTVSINDVYVVSGLGAVTVILILLFYKQLFLVAFDEELAKVDGINVKTFNTLIVVLSAVTVALSMRVVGALLIGALMVIPAVSAMQFGRSFKSTIFLGVCFSVVATLVGLVASFYLNLASGGTIVVVSIIIFIFSLIFGSSTRS